MCENQFMMLFYVNLKMFSQFLDFHTYRLITLYNLYVSWSSCLQSLEVTLFLSSLKMVYLVAHLWYCKKWKPGNIRFWRLYALFPSRNVLWKVRIFVKLCLYISFQIIYNLTGCCFYVLDLEHGPVVKGFGLNCLGKCMS